MRRPFSSSSSPFDAAITAVLEAQYASAERIVNRVRLALLSVLAVAAVLWAPHLTRALNLVNVSVLAPMLTWAIVQGVRYHDGKRPPPGLSALNAYLDIAAVTALLLGYGLRGMPDLAVKSPIWTAYFVILAARPFTGSPRRAAAVASVATLQYAAIATFFIASHGLPFLSNPLDTVHATGTSLLDETAKVMLLLMGGVVVTYATAWNERTLRQSVASMKAHEERFRAVFEHAAVGIAVLDGSSGILHANRAFESFLAYGGHALRNRHLTDFCLAEDADAVATMLREVREKRRGSAVAEARFVRSDGKMAWGSLTLSRAADGQDPRCIAMVQDVTERKSLEARLLHRAFHDPLTELANRALFRDRVEHALARNARASERIAVLLIDLDNFKAVNDTEGHDAGDRLLQVVADRLLTATRGCDTVARLGGDEFGVLLEHVHAGEGGEIVAERVATALHHPLEVVTGRPIAISASIGIAIPRDEDSAEELLRNADLAMYAAKSRARGRWLLFDSQMHTAVVDRVSLENDLRRALERNKLRLAYQPIVDLESGEITGVEALARWSHPGRGSVPPSAFIPVAEDSGLIVTLGAWALREACKQAAAWNQVRGTPLTITVNLSGRQLERETLPAEVAAVLRETRLPPDRLVLEITETVIMEKAEAIVERLHALKALGVRLAIDDFGTGYSSLSYLQQFPVDVLKIDRGFTEGLLRGANEIALVRTIVSLAQMLDLRTIAEGVEESRQQEQLLELGCHAGQGFLFSRPLPARQVTELVCPGSNLYRMTPERALAAT